MNAKYLIFCVDDYKCLVYPLEKDLDAGVLIYTVLEFTYQILRSFLKISKSENLLFFLGCTDLTDGNIKLVLALIWQLILRYQIGLSNIQHKNWMLAWLQAVIPECNITNLTTDWNDGVALQ